MKKIVLLVLALLLIGVGYIWMQEVSFSPLKPKDFRKLFSNNETKGEKKCDIDFLGVSSRGEFFEFYSYEIASGSIDLNYPKFNDEWENNKFDNEVIFSKWHSCPVDSTIMTLYKSTLTSNNLDKNECSQFFNKELMNTTNYYSYVYFNELESYFLLYVSKKSSLYYIRRKGF